MLTHVSAQWDLAVASHCMYLVYHMYSHCMYLVYHMYSHCMYLVYHMYSHFKKEKGCCDVASIVSYQASYFTLFSTSSSAT